MTEKCNPDSDYVNDYHNLICMMLTLTVSFQLSNVFFLQSTNCTFIKWGFKSYIIHLDHTKILT